MPDAGGPAKFGPVLEGRSALVTGAGQGLGRGIAIALARAGARVAVVDLNPATAQEVAEELGEHGEPGLAVECDVGERDQVEHAVERAAAELGGLDVLVNNAQDLRGVQKSFMDTDEAHLRQHLDSGLLGTYHFLQTSYPHLKARPGAVVNIGSGAGVMGLAEHFSYAVTKESIRATTRVVAREWGSDGIRVNAVCPAAYDTPAMEHFLESAGEEGRAAMASQIPLGRFGGAEDTASVVVFLASDAASYMTGHTLMVDGGSSMDAGR